MLVLHRETSSAVTKWKTETHIADTARSFGHEAAITSLPSITIREVQPNQPPEKSTTARSERRWAFFVLRVSTRRRNRMSTAMNTRRAKTYKKSLHPSINNNKKRKISLVLKNIFAKGGVKTSSHSIRRTWDGGIIAPYRKIFAFAARCLPRQ